MLIQWNMQCEPFSRVVPAVFKGIFLKTDGSLVWPLPLAFRSHKFFASIPFNPEINSFLGILLLHLTIINIYLFIYLERINIFNDHWKYRLNKKLLKAQAKLLVLWANL